MVKIKKKKKKKGKNLSFFNFKGGTLFFRYNCEGHSEKIF